MFHIFTLFHCDKVTVELNQRMSCSQFGYKYSFVGEKEDDEEKQNKKEKRGEEGGPSIRYFRGRARDGAGRRDAIEKLNGSIGKK